MTTDTFRQRAIKYQKQLIIIMACIFAGAIVAGLFVGKENTAIVVVVGLGVFVAFAGIAHSRYGVSCPSCHKWLIPGLVGGVELHVLTTGNCKYCNAPILDDRQAGKAGADTGKESRESRASEPKEQGSCVAAATAEERNGDGTACKK